MPQKLTVLDAGCGNGRNLIWLSKEYGHTGSGFDFSAAAIEQAKDLAKGLPILFTVRSLQDPFPEEAASVDIVIDFMASHVLTGRERRLFFTEVKRVLKPGGWYIVKTLLRDDDAHAERLLEEHPTDTRGVYIHPRTGSTEYAGSEDELTQEYGALFEIEKKQKSHAHRVHGKPNKRRFIVFYLVKPKG
jgi:cyclopropane fatty-acyl-phospholipid synthase-like methyltransferase